MTDVEDDIIGMYEVLDALEGHHQGRRSSAP